MNRELNAPSREELLAYFMERQYTNHLINMLRDMAVGIPAAPQSQEGEGQGAQNVRLREVAVEIINPNIPNIPNIIPSNQFLNINHNIPINNLINYIMTTDQLNPDDDQ